MNTASLTVYGDDLMLQTIREALPTEPVNDWNKGDARSNGHTHLDSGFTVDIISVHSPALLLEPIRVYLAECASRGITFSESRIVAELQIGLTCVAAPHAPVSFDLALDDLAMLAELGVSVSMTALPHA